MLPSASRTGTWASAFYLELVKPSLQCLLAEAAVATESHVRDGARPRLRPYPVLRHAETLCNLLDSQEPSHSDQADNRTAHAIGFRDFPESEPPAPAE